uniref:Major facilitator superfamily (MFS) profile domain-containing protein n=1 Tax=Amphimedon queenslandica TaxID=400682 RepID=A0A1X7UZ04_AMPQE
MVSLVTAKKWATWTTIAVFFLSGGMEYSVILPTCWDYMHEEFGAQKWLYGLTISAMSISNLLIGPIMGAIYDKTHQTKILVLFLNLFEIGGNLLYFAAKSKYTILASRFLTGVGWSAGTVIFGDLARTSLKNKRATIYSVIMSLRQFGIVLGPAMNVIFRKFNSKIGKYPVNKYTLPGLFMAAVWLILEVMFIFAFYQQPPIGELEEQHEGIQKEKRKFSQNDDTKSDYTKPDYTKPDYDHFNRRAINTEATPLLIKRTNWSISKKLRSFVWMTSSLIYEELVLLLSLFYVVIFMDCAMQAAFNPMAESILGWKDFENSIFFAVQAGINIFSLVLVLVLYRKTKIPDIYYIIFGVTVLLMSDIWILGFFGRGHTSSSNVSLNVFEFTFSFGLIATALPFSWVVGASLYSKLLPMDIQGYGQGVRRSMESLAAIIGPLCSFVSLLFLLLNATVQCNTCGTEGFMELSLLEAKTTNNLQTTGLAESVETRWIITEGDKKIRCSADNSKLTEILVGVDVRTVTGNRNQYPRVEIWADESRYRNTVSVELRLSPQNFTTSGLYRITLPISLRIEKANTGYRLGVFQPADDKSVVRFYKVTRAGQIARVVEVNYNYVSKVSDDGEIALQTSSILIYPITSSNCNYPSIDSSFNTNSLSVTSVIPVSDTRAFPDIQFTCNGIVTKWIIGITQNQDTNKHYPNIYLKRSSELIHALTVDASAATSSNGNVYNFTSDIEVQYGDILVINVTTNSNPMYYQQYNGPLNYQLDSSNGLMPLEHNDYPLISVVVVTPSTQLIKTNTIMLTSTSASNVTNRDKRYFRLGVRQPPEDRSVVRFYKVTGTGQIGEVVEVNNFDVNKDPDDGEIVLQTSSILIYPITRSNCNYPSIDSSFNTNSLSVTNVIPVSDTRAFPDIQFTCNGIVTKWIIGITQNQDTSKHYPNIYLKRSSELIHALTVDASAATSSNGNVYNFTSDIEVQYGDILVINVTTNSNPMYYQQYNGPLNYQLDSSNGLLPLEHNDYPLISVVVEPFSLVPSNTVTSSKQAINTNRITSSSTSSIITNTPTQTFTGISTATSRPNKTSFSTRSSTHMILMSSSNSISYTTPCVTKESTEISTKPASTLLSITLIGTRSRSSTMISTPVSTSGSTGMVATVLIVSALVCKRRWNKTTNRNHAPQRKFSQDYCETKMDKNQNTLSNISNNPAYDTGGRNRCNTIDVSINFAYDNNNDMNTEGIYESISEFVYDEPKMIKDTEEKDDMIINEAFEQVEEEELYI